MRKKKNTTENQLEFLDILNALTGDRRDEQVELAKTLLALPPEQNWPGDRLIPPGSFLDEVVSVFRQTTDIPLELPLYTTLAYTAAWVLQKGAYVLVANKINRPDMYIVLLAPSGSSKSYTVSVINKVIPCDKIENKNTSATWLEEFSQHNRGLMWVEEYAYMLKAMNSQSYAEEKKEYLLKVADNSPIERSTRAGTLRVDDPAMVLLGTTVDETFYDILSHEQLLDGTAQRILFSFGRDDPSRPMSEYAIYETEQPEHMDRLRAAWSRVEAMTVHECYTLTADAIDLHKAEFRALCGETVPKSYLRRVMWRVFKYGLVYHVLLGKTSAEIDREDIAWAHRVTRMHLYDLKRLLDTFNFSGTERVIRAAEDLQARKGRQLTARDLVAGIRAIQNVGQARAILDLMREPSPEAQAAERQAAGGLQRRHQAA